MRRGSVSLGRDIKCNSLSSALAVFSDVDCELWLESTSTTTELAESKAGVLDHQLTDDVSLEIIVQQTKLIDKALGSYTTTK